MRQLNRSNPSVRDVSARICTPRRLWRLTCLCAGVLGLSGCERPAPEPAPAPKVETPTVVVTPPLLDRVGLLAEMDRAASNFASGSQELNTTLAGRRFKVRQPMGCGAPIAQGAVPQGVASLTGAERAGDLRLTLTAIDWTDEMVGGAGPHGWEAVEGFWLTWPWLRTETCPRAPVTNAAPVPSDSESDTAQEATEGAAEKAGVVALPAVTPPKQTAALVAVFEVDSSRLSRRMGRAYEYILRGQAGAPAVRDAEGYRLVFEGRMAAFNDGRSIRCQAPVVDQRPVCAATVQLERVAFETATGQLLAEWR
jgi:hypothetical protein